MLTNESSAVNGCGKNIRSNQNHSSPSISVLWSEQLFVCEKQIHHYGVPYLSVTTSYVVTT